MMDTLVLPDRKADRFLRIGMNKKPVRFRVAAGISGRIQVEKNNLYFYKLPHIAIRNIATLKFIAVNFFYLPDRGMCAQCLLATSNTDINSLVTDKVNQRRFTVAPCQIAIQLF